MQNIFRLILVLCVMALTSCHIEKPVIADTVPVPEIFRANDTTVTGGPDTANIATINWRNFFPDSRLTNLIDTAIRQNPDLLIAAERIKVARARLLVSRYALYPSLNGVASVGVERFGKYTLNGVGNFDTNLSPNLEKDQRIPNPTPDFFLGLRSSWEIDLWGKLRSRRAAATAYMLAREESARFLRTLLVSEVADRYYSLMALDNELKIINKNIALQETALDIIRVQKEAAQATELAVQQFQAQLLFTRSASYRVRQDILETENSLNELLGRFPQSVTRDSLLPLNDQERFMASGVPAGLLLRRPDIREAEFELLAAKANVAAARAAYFPTLNITPFVGLHSFSPSLLLSGASLAYGILGGLTAPLYNQRQIRAEHQISIAANREAYQGYRRTILSAYSEVVNNLNAIENLNQASSYKEQEVKSLQTAVQNARDLYLAGRASYLEIISAQKVLLEAEIVLNHIERDQYLARIGLYRALGGGW